MLVAIETINGARRLPRLHRSPSATLADGDMNPTDIRTMQAIMGQHIQALVSGVQLKNTGALGATQLHCLGRNDLQHTVQVEGGGNNPSDTVNGRQFMNFATQLLI